MDGVAHTTDYFDSHLHNYSAKRLRFVFDSLNRVAKPGQSLVDIGCGTGNILAHFEKETRLELCGIDASSACLKKAAEVSRCETLQGSIIDDRFVSSIGRRFDFAILAAVLHHVIGKTRVESRALAKKAITNALCLLKPHGMLFILEPTFEPRISMDLVFWIKRAITTITSNRVMIGGYWNNIGAPVVSYYGSDELVSLIPDGLRVVEKSISNRRAKPLQRFVGLRRGQAILVIEKS
jgi:2-polyprenyl-3-methyl-5-hydroxy-6-metoxy-1,4-benzoquinol methylase